MDRSTGIARYTPRAGFFGVDTFAYATLDDRLALSNQAVVSVVVTEKEYPWRNPQNPLDINIDGVVGPLDALTIVRDILDHFPRHLPTPSHPGEVVPPFLDSNRDNVVSATDALLVIRQFIDPQPPPLAADAGGVALDRVVSSLPLPASAPAEHPVQLAERDGPSLRRDTAAVEAVPVEADTAALPQAVRRQACRATARRADFAATAADRDNVWDVDDAISLIAAEVCRASQPSRGGK
jgi:hypothetical protein